MTIINFCKTFCSKKWLFLHLRRHKNKACQQKLFVGRELHPVAVADHPDSNTFDGQLLVIQIDNNRLELFVFSM